MCQLRVLLLIMVLPTLSDCLGGDRAGEHRSYPWDALPVVTMKGGLKVFWNVIDNSQGENSAQAASHGFLPVTLINTYADYPGQQRENINKFLEGNVNNPWNKPPFFEKIIRRNIALSSSAGIYVHDIEFAFQEDAAKAWNDATIRGSSGAKDFGTFEEAYFREWASWFWMPLKWTKEQQPDAFVGLYGIQPFHRDYWGIAGKEAQQIDGTHRSDERLWNHIDKYVDFYTVSTYVFYDRPDSIYYIAANIEENYRRTRKYGDKPVFVYEWLRFHDSSWWEGGRELDEYLVEAMAIIPFFSGARGIVLWGYEPQIKPGDGQAYRTLPVFMENLKRVANLSEKIGKAQLVIDDPAHRLWKSEQPLIRRLIVGPAECVILVVNPWQSEEDTTSTPVRCGQRDFAVDVRGRRTTLVHIDGNNMVRY
jgi:hypothetical protein